MYSNLFLSFIQTFFWEFVVNLDVQIALLKFRKRYTDISLSIPSFLSAFQESLDNFEIIGQIYSLKSLKYVISLIIICPMISYELRNLIPVRDLEKSHDLKKLL